MVHMNYITNISNDSVRRHRYVMTSFWKLTAFVLRCCLIQTASIQLLFVKHTIHLPAVTQCQLQFNSIYMTP